eukprot:GHRQ01034289.1.p2 GENE.GHRQ01034289.1~~GHRQ01034289.1.p2  ORF type:complete len:108 (+),score=47.87 GHRQ01034289.1:28-324(+)
MQQREQQLLQCCVHSSTAQHCLWLPSMMRFLPCGACALQGSYLRKYGRRGKPKTHYFRLSGDDRELLWDSSNVSSSAAGQQRQRHGSRAAKGSSRAAT